MTLEYVIRPINELDPRYLELSAWTENLTAKDYRGGVICQAFDERDYDVGRLAIDRCGKILIVEVEPAHRRQGVATRLLAELEAAGYKVVHDWENMRDDGAAWARAVEGLRGGTKQT